MIKNRIAGLYLAISSCAWTAGLVVLSAGCSLEPDPAAVAAPLQAALVTGAHKGDAHKGDAQKDDTQSTAPQSGSDELERAYTDLDKEYQAGKRAYAEAVEARRKAGEPLTEVDTKNVASDFWPRFQALADKGSGHARLWMALEMQPAFKSRERALNQRESVKLLEEVVAKNADEPWIGSFAKNLTALYIILPEEEVDRLVDVFAGHSTRKEVVAEALYRAAMFDKSSKRAGAAARADELMKRIQREFADTEYGKKARGEEPRAIGFRIGDVAPDFTTKDADGVAFKLGDYRGKIVVLDFWGFW